MKGTEQVRRVIILCPANLKINWLREARKWLVGDYSVGIAQGDYLPDTDIVIINFDIIARHVRQLQEMNADVYIVDESHYLKNPDSKRSKAALSIKAKCNLFLTGTPILNRPVELFPLLSALDPERWSNFWLFAKRYTNARPNGFGHDFSGASNLGELQEILRSTVMIRRLKKDVLEELPPKRRQIVELDNKKVLDLINQERRQATLFREMQREMMISETIARTFESPKEFKEKLSRLHSEKSQSLRDYARARRRLALAKAYDAAEFIRMYLDADPAYKLVVFCHHLELVEIIYRAFENRAVFLVGDMSIEEKQKSIDDFQQRADIQLFVGTMGACREGHNLTAGSHIIFVEPDPTPGRMTQAEDRCHRIGQKSSLLIQHLVYNGSIDVSVIRTAVRKQEIVDRALDIKPDESCELLPPADMDEAAVLLFEKNAGRAFDSEFEFRKTRRDSVAWQVKDADYEKFDLSEVAETEIEIWHQNMRLLAEVCDGGEEFDGRGFNKYDSIVGHYLAKLKKLNRRQLYLAKKLSYKYRRQLAEIKLNN
jgi:SWI/SNF-related matrix-associated actin-dependent regulator 1 of chromatin subfamily A